MGFYVPRDWQFIDLVPQLWWLIPYLLVGFIAGLSLFDINRGTRGRSPFDFMALPVIAVVWGPLLCLFLLIFIVHRIVTFFKF